MAAPISGPYCNENWSKQLPEVAGRDSLVMAHDYAFMLHPPLGEGIRTNVTRKSTQHDTCSLHAKILWVFGWHINRYLCWRCALQALTNLRTFARCFSCRCNQFKMENYGISTVRNEYSDLCSATYIRIFIVSSSMRSVHGCLLLGRTLHSFDKVYQIRIILHYDEKKAWVYKLCECVRFELLFAANTPPSISRCVSALLCSSSSASLARKLCPWAHSPAIFVSLFLFSLIFWLWSGLCMQCFNVLLQCLLLFLPYIGRDTRVL